MTPDDRICALLARARRDAEARGVRPAVWRRLVPHLADLDRTHAAGLSWVAIARALGIPPSTLMHALPRARAEAAAARGGERTVARTRARRVAAREITDPISLLDEF